MKSAFFSQDAAPADAIAAFREHNGKPPEQPEHGNALPSSTNPASADGFQQHPHSDTRAAQHPHHAYSTYQNGSGAPWSSLNGKDGVNQHSGAQHPLSAATSSRDLGHLSPPLAQGQNAGEYPNGVAETLGKNPAGQSAGVHAMEDLIPEPPEVHEARERLAGMRAYHADDYDTAESDLHRELLLCTSERQFELEQFTSWLISFLIGVVNGCFGAGFNLCISSLNYSKFTAVEHYISADGGWVAPWCVMIAFSISFAIVAGVLGSYVSKQAAGSGIPDIRAYLNGVHIKNLLSLRTLVAKSFGVSFSIASGLIAGKEGPFIHIGAIIGGGVSSLGSQSLTRWTGGKLQAKLRRRLGTYFRHPVEHRDYVAVGTAAGISTAFGAPIGGILFAVEQGTSWFSTRMLWHAVLAAGVALYVTVVLMGADYYDAGLGLARLGRPLDFVLEKAVQRPYWYAVWELPIHALMGILGGLISAGIVVVNHYVVNFRIRYIPRSKPIRRVIELVFYALITSTLWFAISYTSPCDPIPAPSSQAAPTSSAYDYVSDLGATATSPTSLYPQLWCPEGTYSAYGALFFTPLSGSVARLYHSDRAEDGSDADTYNHTAVGLMFLLVTALIPFSYGWGAASGIFVPLLLSGAAGGRLVGQVVRAALLSCGFHSAAHTVSIQSYAVVGSAAMLGGTTRMLLSSSVLIMETTGADNLMVPLIIASFFGKMVGDALTVGIYDTTILRATYPYLPQSFSSLHHIKLGQQLTVGEVMTSNPKTLPVLIKIRDLAVFLRAHDFSTFPLTCPDLKTIRSYVSALSAAHDEQTRRTGTTGKERKEHVAVGKQISSPSSGQQATVDGVAGMSGRSQPQPQQSQSTHQQLSPGSQQQQGQPSVNNKPAVLELLAQLMPPNAGITSRRTTMSDLQAVRPLLSQSRAPSQHHQVTSPSQARGTGQVVSPRPHQQGTAPPTADHPFVTAPADALQQVEAVASPSASHQHPDPSPDPRYPAAAQVPSKESRPGDDTAGPASAPHPSGDPPPPADAKPLPFSSELRYAKEGQQPSAPLSMVLSEGVKAVVGHLQAAWSQTMTRRTASSARGSTGAAEHAAGHSGSAGKQIVQKDTGNQEQDGQPQPEQQAALQAAMAAQHVLSGKSGSQVQQHDSQTISLIPSLADAGSSAVAGHVSQVVQRKLTSMSSDQTSLLQRSRHSLDVGGYRTQLRPIGSRSAVIGSSGSHHGDVRRGVTGVNSRIAAAALHSIATTSRPPTSASGGLPIRPHGLSPRSSRPSPANSLTTWSHQPSLIPAHPNPLSPSAGQQSLEQVVVGPHSSGQQPLAHVQPQLRHTQTQQQRSQGWGTSDGVVLLPPSAVAEGIVGDGDVGGDSTLGTIPPPPMPFTGSAQVRRPAAVQPPRLVIDSSNNVVTPSSTGTTRAGGNWSRPHSPAGHTAPLPAQSQQSSRHPAGIPAQGLQQQSQDHDGNEPGLLHQSDPKEPATQQTAQLSHHHHHHLELHNQLGHHLRALGVNLLQHHSQHTQQCVASQAGQGGEQHVTEEEKEEEDAALQAIIGVITRRTLLRILQAREGFCASLSDAAALEERERKGRAHLTSARLQDAVSKLNKHAWAPPNTREGMESVLASLSEQELDSWINLRHYMQRVPFTIPATASVGRAYHLFRSLGLHHLLVTPADAPVVGLLTRTDLVSDRMEVAMSDKLRSALMAANAITSAPVAPAGSPVPPIHPSLPTGAPQPGSQRRAVSRAATPTPHTTGTAPLITLSYPPPHNLSMTGAARSHPLTSHQLPSPHPSSQQVLAQTLTSSSPQVHPAASPGQPAGAAQDQQGLQQQSPRPPSLIDLQATELQGSAHPPPVGSLATAAPADDVPGELSTGDEGLPGARPPSLLCRSFFDNSGPWISESMAASGQPPGHSARLQPVVDAEVPYPVRVMLGQHPAPEVVIEDAASDAQQVPLIHLEGVMSPSAAPLGSSNRGSGVGLPLTQHPPSHLHPGSVTIDIAPSDDWQQQPASSLQRLSERVTQDDEVEVDREHTWDRPVAVVSAGGQQQQKQQGAQQLELLKRRLEELHTSRSNLSAMVQGTFQPNVLDEFGALLHEAEAVGMPVQPATSPVRRASLSRQQVAAVAAAQAYLTPRPSRSGTPEPGAGQVATPRRDAA